MPPYDILTYGPYQKGRINDIQIIPFIKNSFDLNDLNKSIDRLFDLSYLNEFPFNKKINKFKDLIENYKGYNIQTKSLPNLNFYNFYKDTLYIIIYDDLLTQGIRFRVKLSAIKQNAKIQFIHINHLRNFNLYIIFNIWMQLLAKSGGKPWIVDNASNFFKNNTLLIGISFSKINDKILYGVSHFVDLHNLDQVIEVSQITRTDEFRGIMLRKNEMLDVLKKGVDWFHNKNPHAKDVNIYIYKTSPLHFQEADAINAFISEKENYGFSDISLSHIHVKSKNFGIPRMFDIENLDTSYRYMNRMGQCIKIKYDASINNTVFRDQTEFAIATTGYISFNNKNKRGTLGTPKPLFLHVSSTNNDMGEYVKKHVMAMKAMDWESPNIQNSGLFILKYSGRMAKMLSYLKANSGIALPEFFDVTYLM
jgi:hypothetical protein